ncbi:hypothetical protein EHS25_002022 [Saitozyma podzolica]|uniref:Carbohydrate kinase PfkB domain-containing protein n=1 Tax=Saitozyma podzolica TaxID=1890683 RepID=A0A427YEM0_9TREE|nr:hypothetical protein EHS25_002022 [Saitozyma podzolica]
MSRVDTLVRPTSASLKGKGRVCTLGMFIIDHFEVQDEGGQPVPIDEEAIGGGGVHAMTAARLFLPPSHCALLVDRGDDFPQHFADQLEALGADMVWFRRRDGKTTRALNIYSGTAIGEGHQTFQYLSPQLNLSLRDLLVPPSPFATPHHPEWVHVVVRIPRAQFLVQEARQIFEAGPDRASKELEDWLNLANHFAAISPNLIELQTVLSLPRSEETQEDVVHAAEIFHRKLREAHADAAPALVLRAGALGSYTIATGWKGWVPAYWRPTEQNRVVDVTGGGNAFLGGLCAGLLASDGDYRIGW